MPDIETATLPATPVAQPVTIVEPAKLSIEDTMAAVYDKANPTRTDNGQFKGKVEALPTEGAELGDTDKTIPQEPIVKADEPAKEPDKAPDKPAIVRPQSWSADLDEWWNALPPERQEFLAKRESDAHQKIAELGRTAKSAEQMRQLMEPLRNVAVRNRTNEAEVIKRFTAADDFLRNDPHVAIQWLAQSYGVDLSRFAQPPQPGEQPAESTHYNALTRQLTTAQRQIAELTDKLANRERNESASQMASLDNLVADFSKGKDYWPDIEDEVETQIRAIRAKHPDKDASAVLAEAHDRAIKLNDAVSNKLSEAKRKEEAVKKAADDKRKAEDAKKLASLNVKSSPGKSPSSKSLNMESEMGDIYDKVSARG